MVPIAQRADEQPRISPDEYLSRERAHDERHEFVDGFVLAMAGGSPRHAALSARVVSELDRQLRGRCIVLTSDQRVGWLDRQRYVYPDASAVCGPLEIESGDVLTNPTLIVEVLSESTEANDRGAKWTAYRRIASLHAYVLVWQREPLVEIYGRLSRERWSYECAGPGERASTGIGAILDVDLLYEGLLSLPGD